MTYDLYIINLFCFIFIIRIFKLVLKSYLTAKRIFFSHLPPLSPTRSLFSWFGKLNAQEKQMNTRMTEGTMRQERHKKRQTNHKARENGLSRSSDFLAWKLKRWKAKYVHCDLRVCLNNRGFPSFLFSTKFMQTVQF